MAMAADEIERLIRQGLPDATVEIREQHSESEHNTTNDTSSAFAGKSRVQQHQMVYQALKGHMGVELHALALQTQLPADK